MRMWIPGRMLSLPFQSVLELCVCVCYSLSHVLLLTTTWTVAHQAPLSMEFSRQESWSGLQFSSSGDLPHLGIEPGSPTLQAESFLFGPPGKPL